MSLRPTVYTDEAQVTGEGITRTSDPRARLWALVIPLPGLRPLHCTIRATSKAEAIRFAAARHPSADPDRIRVLSKPEAGGLL